MERRHQQLTFLVEPQVDQHLTEVATDAAISSKGHSMLEHVKDSQIHQAEHVQTEVMDLQRNMPFAMKLGSPAGRVMKKIVSMSGQQAAKQRTRRLIFFPLSVCPFLLLKKPRLSAHRTPLLPIRTTSQLKQRQRLLTS